MSVTFSSPGTRRNSPELVNINVSAEVITASVEDKGFPSNWNSAKGHRITFSSNMSCRACMEYKLVAFPPNSAEAAGS